MVSDFLSLITGLSQTFSTISNWLCLIHPFKILIDFIGHQAPHVLPLNLFENQMAKGATKKPHVGIHGGPAMAGTTAATSGHGIGIPHGYHEGGASGMNTSSNPYRPTSLYGQGTSMGDLNYSQP